MRKDPPVIAEDQSLIDASVTFLCEEIEVLPRATKDCWGSLIKTHLLPYFGDKRLSEITPTEVQMFMDGLRGLSANSLHGVYNLVKLLFEIASQFDLIEKSPVRPLMHRPASVETTVEKPTLSFDDIKAILKALPAKLSSPCYNASGALPRHEYSYSRVCRMSGTGWSLGHTVGPRRSLRRPQRPLRLLGISVRDQSGRHNGTQQAGILIHAI